ncbi:hypothetical protein AV521_45545 [Streptomyces sp. IMTB 2501]|uniref:hypothetical protein n=1 Tax=Streptomyces sp. IMTB 2501 TaxID=1776340 RepID=UPI00096D870E|nr:hypothetical protein [Streptomyces sp. IMTB 2501]OLZ59343.1 hypothetical protein AV521_45545 [Streptomyces sp. IMTB 2501]
MTDGGKDLKTDGLALIAKGLTDALGELKDLGAVGEAGAGRGFGEISLSGLELGHEGLTDAFKSFCERWEWGVRSLINEGNGFALRTGLAAGTYYETDQYVAGTAKVAENALIGNPYASEEDVERRGYGDIAASGAFGGNVDYSEKSFDQAWANSEQGWMDADRDFATSQAGANLGLRPSGMSDAEYNKYLDEVFGPSPEARARAAEQQGGQG